MRNKNIYPVSSRNLYNKTGECTNCSDAGYDDMVDQDHIKKGGLGCTMFVLVVVAIVVVSIVCFTYLNHTK